MDQVRRGQFPQCRQHRLDSKRCSEGRDGERDSGEDRGHQANDGHQRGADGAHAPPRPPHRPRQFDVRPQRGGRRLEAGRALDPHHHLLHRRERRGQPRCCEIRQEAHREVPPPAAPARNPDSSRVLPLVRSVPGNPAPSLGMHRTSLQSGRQPGPLANVLLNGQPGLEPKLHPMKPARWHPSRASPFLGRSTMPLPWTRLIPVASAGKFLAGALRDQPPPAASRRGLKPADHRR